MQNKPEQTTQEPILADTIDLTKVTSVALRRLIEEVRRDPARIPVGYNRTYDRYLPSGPGGYNRVYHRHNR